jgi:hypothetical protein
VRPRTRPVELGVTDAGQVRGGASYGSSCSHDCVGRHRTLRQQAAPCALTPSGAGHNVRGKRRVPGSRISVVADLGRGKSSLIKNQLCKSAPWAAVYVFYGAS